MEFQWLGNSSFLIKTSLGKRILIDPFNALKHYDNNIYANIITLSKNIAGDIARLDTKPEVKIICGNDTYSDEHIKIKGYSTFSDKLKGLKRGVNYIYTYEVDSLKLCHLGYLGEIPNDELINTLKFADFLFVPIGGGLCLDGHEANTLCKLLSPRFVVPMSYNYNSYDFYFDGPKTFLSSNKNILKVNSDIVNTCILPKDNNTITLLLK